MLNLVVNIVTTKVSRVNLISDKSQECSAVRFLALFSVHQTGFYMPWQHSECGSSLIVEVLSEIGTIEFYKQLAAFLTYLEYEKLWWLTVKFMN
jgi:predicted nucleotide-binding protein (sugar kinase/HSP70/actin superfamily)